MTAIASALTDENSEWRQRAADYANRHASGGEGSGFDSLIVLLVIGIWLFIMIQAFRRNWAAGEQPGRAGRVADRPARRPRSNPYRHDTGLRRLVRRWRIVRRRRILRRRRVFWRRRLVGELVMEPLLSPADRDRIAAAIGAAEARTAGEIYCVVARHTSDYRFVPVFWAALASVLVPAAILLLGVEPHRWAMFGEPWWTGEATAADVTAWVRSGMVALVICQAVAFLVVVLATWPPAIRVRVTPRAVRQDRVHRAAVDQFLARGMQRTRDRTGVLIFVALAERQVEVVADEGIFAKVEPRVWDDAVGALIVAAREGRLGDGFVEAVALCGGVLAEHFPPRPDDIDEVPNHVIEL